jgi:hypothetical protein
MIVLKKFSLQKKKIKQTFAAQFQTGFGNLPRGSSQYKR